MQNEIDTIEASFRMLEDSADTIVLRLCIPISQHETD